MSTVRAAAETLSIGEVATQLGVPISTLRWWEQSGLVQASERLSNRRRYTVQDMRRIATVHLWQTHANLSLDEIAIFLAGSTRDADWRDAVRARLAACDEHIKRLRSARGTLQHLLECPSDHPADDCPYLGDIVDTYVASGRMPEQLSG